MSADPMDMDSRTYRAGMFLTRLLDCQLTDDERDALHAALAALDVTIRLRELCASVLERERYWTASEMPGGKSRFGALMAGDVARGVLKELDA